MSRYIVAVLLVLALASCQPETYTPKRPGYYRVDLPAKHEYQLFNEPGFPYSFEYPVYAHIIHDTSFFGEKPENPYWLNIDFPSLNGTIYLSYKQISAQQPLDKLLNDAHEMSYFHTKRADYIDDQIFSNGYGASGIFYTAGGNSASTYQFVATDSTRHFLRGALYFNVTPNADSLKPVNEFIREDMLHMIKTLRWK